MRRKALIDKMEALESEGLDCHGCDGNCCTYEANSIMLTPLEAMDLILHLKTSGTLTPELKAKCHETVERFRLGHPTGNGRRSFLRRTYTCPFFNHAEFGCPLPREVKPYGCLAFNSHHAKLKGAGHCYSDKELLELRGEDNSDEAEENELLRKKHNISWEKTPLPLALIELWGVEV